MQTWDQIRSLIKADIAAGGPKAKDRILFACLSDQGWFDRTYNDQAITLTYYLEGYWLQIAPRWMRIAWISPSHGF